MGFECTGYFTGEDSFSVTSTQTSGVGCGPRVGVPGNMRDISGRQTTNYMIPSRTCVYYNLWAAEPFYTTRKSQKNVGDDGGFNLPHPSLGQA